MKDLLPYGGMPREVRAALSTLEAADRFDGIAQAYGIVKQEAQRRFPIFLALCVPTAALGAALVWGMQNLDWLPQAAPWAYAFGPILLLALVMSQLRPQAAHDDMRIGKALNKWRTQANAAT